MSLATFVQNLKPIPQTIDLGFANWKKLIFTFDISMGVMVQWLEQLLHNNMAPRVEGSNLPVYSFFWATNREEQIMNGNGLTGGRLSASLGRISC